MKPVVRNLLFVLAVAAFAAVCGLILAYSLESRRLITCEEAVDVQLPDAERSFVSEQDVKDYLRDYYGPYTGARLDSVDLDRIETVLDARSAIRKSEAWTTDDGILHISITQREPVVRFMKSGTEGFYADDRGFIFPLQEAWSPEVPVVDGKIPLYAGADYKGEPGTQAEKEWMAGLLSLLEYMKGSRRWAESFSRITVEENGALVLIPAEGNERFIFGSADSPREKFARIDSYYRYIKPSKDEDYYHTVDVRYDGQIICRNK